MLLRQLLATSALALVLASSLPGCTREAAPPGRAPVLVLAVDGLEWSLVRGMLRDGDLPNLASMLREGRFGELETMHPSLSPTIWTSVATGVKPQVHGIRGFVKGGREPELFTNRDRRVKAVWNIASDHGRTSHVIGWWTTFPVEPIRGIMVAQVNTSLGDRARDGGVLKGGILQNLRHQVHPEERSERMLGLAAEVDAGLDAKLDTIFRGPRPRAAAEAATGAATDQQQGDDVARLWQQGDDVARLWHQGDDVARLWRESLWSLRADLAYERIALEALADDPAFDLALVYFGGTDVLAHRFWRWAFPDRYEFPPDEASVAAHGQVIADYYRYIDGAVGRLRDAAPAGTLTIVMSDHGMDAANRRKPFVDKPEGRPMRSGAHGSTDTFFAAAGPGVRPPDAPVDPARLGPKDIPRLGSIFDVAPTLLRLLDLPLADDMPGRVLEEVLDPAFLQAHPAGRVETHTPPGWFEGRALPDIETPEAGERLQQLRSLGYIQ